MGRKEAGIVCEVQRQKAEVWFGFPKREGLRGLGESGVDDNEERKL